MLPAGEMWSVVMLSPRKASGRARFTSPNFSGSFGMFSKKERRGDYSLDGTAIFEASHRATGSSAQRGRVNAPAAPSAAWVAMRAVS
jgi:hypothetical protein